MSSSQSIRGRARICHTEGQHVRGLGAERNSFTEPGVQGGLGEEEWGREKHWAGWRLTPAKHMGCPPWYFVVRSVNKGYTRGKKKRRGFLKGAGNIIIGPCVITMPPASFLDLLAKLEYELVTYLHLKYYIFPLYSLIIFSQNKYWNSSLCISAIFVTEVGFLQKFMIFYKVWKVCEIVAYFLHIKEEIIT